MFFVAPDIVVILDAFACTTEADAARSLGLAILYHCDKASRSCTTPTHELDLACGSDIGSRHFCPLLQGMAMLDKMCPNSSIKLRMGICLGAVPNLAIVFPKPIERHVLDGHNLSSFDSVVIPSIDTKKTKAGDLTLKLCDACFCLFYLNTQIWHFCQIETF
jgi:hypothetical protein